MNSKLKRFAVAVPILGVFLLYSNCSDGFKSSMPDSVSSASKDSTSNDVSEIKNNDTGSETSKTPAPTTTPTTPTPNVTPNTTPNVTAFKCKPPRYYSYTLQPGQEKTFSCSPTMSDIFNVTIPDTGYAIGRASLVFRNNNTENIYYWGASVVVGSGDISYGQGDDICPNTATPVKRALGYGNLTAGNSVVRVLGTQGSSPCVDNQISVFSGGTLEVWVEDPDPRCQKKDINMISSYQTMGLSKYYWTPSMTKLVSLSVPATTEARSRLLVVSAVEGSPESNPNSTCGSESATLVAQAATNLQGVVDTQIDVIPASQGMGHVVLSPQALVSYATTLNEVSLYVGSNTANAVFTNDCCGDGKVGFIKLP